VPEGWAAWWAALDQLVLEGGSGGGCGGGPGGGGGGGDGGGGEPGPWGSWGREFSGQWLAPILCLAALSNTCCFVFFQAAEDGGSAALALLSLGFAVPRAADPFYRVPCA